MSDLAKWKVQGAVESLRRETATWELHEASWQPTQSFTFVTFRRDGKISTSEFHNPDGSVYSSRSLYDDAGRLIESTSWFNDEPVIRTVYRYDDAGRHVRTVRLDHDGTETQLEASSYDARGHKTKTHFWEPLSAAIPSGASFCYAIEGTDWSVTVPGVATMTTVYDDRELPVEALLHDANNGLLTRVTFERDGGGRVLREATHVGGQVPFGSFLDTLPPEQREGVAAILQTFGDTFSRTTYGYDPQGRRVERTVRMGSLHEERTSYRYDDRGELVEETTERRDRDGSIEEGGTVSFSSDRLDVQHCRFEHLYDAHGNWTERIVWIRHEPNADFQRSNVERRVITYYSE